MEARRGQATYLIKQLTWGSTERSGTCLRSHSLEMEAQRGQETCLRSHSLEMEAQRDQETCLSAQSSYIEAHKRSHNLPKITQLTYGSTEIR